MGDGLVTPERLAALSAVSFSGRLASRSFDAGAMVAELERYAPAHGWRHGGTWIRREAV